MIKVQAKFLENYGHYVVNQTYVLPLWLAKSLSLSGLVCYEQKIRGLND